MHVFPVILFMKPNVPLLNCITETMKMLTLEDKTNLVSVESNLQISEQLSFSTLITNPLILKINMRLSNCQTAMAALFYC